jgi:hypothetical protein
MSVSKYRANNLKITVNNKEILEIIYRKHKLRRIQLNQMSIAALKRCLFQSI